MGRILSGRFFNRNTEVAARELLGCFLVRRIGRRQWRLPITEVEVYDGLKDKASHASRGETTRNKIMFGEPGRFYVYFTYGMHWMLNIVTREKGYPAAILIRGLKPSQAWFAQGGGKLDGPAKLTKAFKIDGKLNGKLASRTTGLWLEKGASVPIKSLQRLPRVGVAYAGPYWSRRRLRFRFIT